MNGIAGKPRLRGPLLPGRAAFAGRRLRRALGLARLRHIVHVTDAAALVDQLDPIEIAAVGLHAFGAQYLPAGGLLRPAHRLGHGPLAGGHGHRRSREPTVFAAPTHGRTGIAVALPTTLLLRPRGCGPAHKGDGENDKSERAGTEHNEIVTGTSQAGDERNRASRVSGNGRHVWAEAVNSV